MTRDWREFLADVVRYSEIAADLVAKSERANPADITLVLALHQVVTLRAADRAALEGIVPAETAGTAIANLLRNLPGGIVNVGSGLALECGCLALWLIEGRGGGPPRLRGLGGARPIRARRRVDAGSHRRRR